MKVLFLTAFPDETQSVLKFFPKTKILDKKLHVENLLLHELFFLETGMGFQNAGYALQKFFEKKIKIDRCFIFGFCGALDEALQVGQIVTCKKVLKKTEDSSWEFACSPIEETHIQPIETLLSMDKIIRTSKEKKELFMQTHAQAVDMESGIFVQLLNQNQIPVTVVKAVMDSAEHEIPQNIRQPLNEEKNLLEELKNNMKMAKERLEKDFLEKFFDEFAKEK